MKKIKYFLKKNFKKFLVLLSVFVIAFSCFIIPSSAETIAFNTPYSKPIVNENSGYIEIFLCNGGGDIVYVYTWFFTVVDTYDMSARKPFVEISVPKDNTVNAEVYKIFFEDVDVTPLTFSYGYCSSYDSGCAVYYKSTLQESLSVNCWFPTQYDVALIRCYGICIPDDNYKNYFSGYVDGAVVYGDNTVLNDKFDIVIDSLGGYQTEIQQSIQQGNQQVIENANQNVDKILNSGEYTLDMGDSTARLESIENSVFESVDLETINQEIFNNLNLWNELTPSIMCSGIILDELLNFGGTKNTWFIYVVRFGLAIGVLSLFLAIAPNIFKNNKGGKE